MFGKVLSFLDRRQHVGRALRVYLWWGLLIRGAVLLALCTLLIVEGNFLAEWLLSFRIVQPMSAGLEEYTALGYGALMVFLVGGIYGRWMLLQQMKNAKSTSDAGDEGDKKEGPAD